MTDHDERNYQILNTLATGGTAVLYKAIQTSLDRHVVVKRLHSHLISDPNFTKRFEIEAKAAASLDHENIVRIIDFGSSHDNYYIVMEYIEGLSLKELIDKHGVLDPELTLLIAREICLGLDHAHQHGIVHRDIKPANIMITSDGQVKITDFGLAKLHQAQTHQTVANTLLGTPLYMSPEQATGNTVDGRSDLFSLGTMCYEMATGTQPFLGDNYAVVIQNILHGSIPQPSKLRKNISSEIESTIMKALCREAGKRYRTALEMARTIETILGQEKIPSAKRRLKQLVQGKRCPESTGEETSSSRPYRSRPRRSMRLLPAMLASAAVAISAAVYILNPGAFDVLRIKFSAMRSPDPALAPIEAHMLGSGDMFSTVPIDPSHMPAVADSAVSVLEVPGDTAVAVQEPDDTVATRIEVATVELEPEPPPQPPRPAIGYLDITVEPSAAVYIDGEKKTDGTHTGTLELEAGIHSILCEKHGYREYKESVTITRGEMSKRRIILQRVQGGVFFNTTPGAMIYINGAYKGLTPTGKPIMIPTGNCRIELKKVGYNTWSSDVYIPPDETIWLDIKLSPQQTSR